MALTRAIIQSNPLLKGLSDEQLLALEVMSSSDENSVIGARFGEVYRQLDETIESATGIARNGSEKTYKYLERAVGEFAGKFSDYGAIKESLSALTKENDELKGKIQSGAADQETARLYKQSLADLEALRKQYDAVKAEYDGAVKQHEADLFGIRVDGVMDSARASLKFKSGINEAMASLAVKEAMSKVRGLNPDFVDDGQGGRTLIFRNADGTTMNNPDNGLKPFTAEDLLRRELSAYGILESGRKGGTGSQGKEPDPSAVTIGGCATQAQAMAAIQKVLASKGLVAGTMSYQNELDKLYVENNVNSLPIGSDE